MASSAIQGTAFLFPEQLEIAFLLGWKANMLPANAGLAA